MTTTIALFAGALFVSVILALGSYLALLVREMAADKRAREPLEEIGDLD